MIVRFYDEAEDSLLQFAVIIAKAQGKWVFCRHRERNTYEIPGGHREAGETIDETAARELREETGACAFSLQPLCCYSAAGKNCVNETGDAMYGRIYTAEIQEFLPDLHSEMAEVILLDHLPKQWTYPDIQPLMIEEYMRRIIRLVPVKAEERQLLWNLNQKYLYEMSAYYANEIDEEGNIIYGYFDAYFNDPSRSALFIYAGTHLAGFAMVNQYSCFDEPADAVMAEFTIFPIYRKQRIAITAARRILAMYPGKWQIKYNENNIAAKALWNKVTEPYHPAVRRYSPDETVLIFTAEAGVL